MHDQPKRSPKQNLNDDAPQDAHPNEWLTPQEIAQDLKVNQQSVRNWLRDGLLVGAKFSDVWRVRRIDYDAFVAESVRRGQRYEAGDELRAQLEQYGFHLMESYGGGERVDLIIDLDPTDRKRNEIRLTSSAIKDSRENERQSAYECTAGIEDSDDQPYDDLVVHGRTHTEAFMNILSVIHEFEQRQRSENSPLGHHD